MFSQEFVLHSGAVRAICALENGGFASGGLDGVLGIWEIDGNFKSVKAHSDFILCVASESQLIATGSKDKTAVLRDLNNPAEALAVFTGHDGPVCAVGFSGELIFTGSWDGHLRLFSHDAICMFSVQAGSFAVSAVALPAGVIATGAQEGTLRLWRGDEMFSEISKAHADIIRGFSVFEAGFFTVSNDGDAKLWSFEGEELLKFPGSAAFLFGCASSAGYLYTAGDDGALTIWDLATSNFQKIQHPQTLWGVAVLKNGDFVTACADGKIRSFTHEISRSATEAEIAAFNASSVKVSALPKEGVKPLKDLEICRGQKEGQIQMFGDNREVLAYQWRNGIWELIGTVTGSAAPEKKKFPGDRFFPAGDYDFIFDVEVGEGGKKALLPFNRGENFLLVAEKFCAREEIGKDNVPDITAFLKANAPDLEISSQPEAAAPIQKYYPLVEPMIFKDGKWPALEAKLLQLNSELEPPAKIEKENLQYLTFGVGKLAKGQNLTISEVDVIARGFGKWPKEKLFPAVDLWRLFLCHPQSGDIYKGADRGFQHILFVLEIVKSDPSDSPLTLCCCRYFANLFCYSVQKWAAVELGASIIPAVAKILQGKPGKPTMQAAVAVLANFACTLCEKKNAELANLIIRQVVEVLKADLDAENIFKLLATLGTAKFGDAAAVKSIAAQFSGHSDPRIREICQTL